MIKKEISVANVGVLGLSATEDMVVVELEYFAPRDPMTPVALQWDDITNMDIIYDRFQDLQMKTFKPLAEALGVMYANRELYKALL